MADQARRLAEKKRKARFRAEMDKANKRRQNDMYAFFERSKLSEAERLVKVAEQQRNDVLQADRGQRDKIRVFVLRVFGPLWPKDLRPTNLWPSFACSRPLGA